MRRPACKICGSEVGPAIFAADDTCCVWCQKVANGEMSAEEFEKRTGRKVL